MDVAKIEQANKKEAAAEHLREIKRSVRWVEGRLYSLEMRDAQSKAAFLVFFGIAVGVWIMVIARWSFAKWFL